MPRGKNNSSSTVGQKTKAKKPATKSKTRQMEREKPAEALPPQIDPDVENQADMEDINELINNDIETDEEWESDAEDAEGDGYDNQFVDSDADDADDCAYDVTRRKKAGLNLDDIDDDDDMGDEEEFDDPTSGNYKTVIPEAQRICTSMITKYERVRLLSDRTTQLALGAKPMIRGVEEIKHSDREKMIAQLEFEARVIPIILERERPDGAFEHWKLSELRYKDDMIVYGKGAFADPTTLTVDPTYIQKRSKELQTGGNITGFTKVTQNQNFNLPKNNFGESDSVRSWKYHDVTALEALLGYNQDGGAKSKSKSKSKPKPKPKAKARATKAKATKRK